MDPRRVSSEGRGASARATERGRKVEYLDTQSELSDLPKTQGHSRIRVDEVHCGTH